MLNFECSKCGCRGKIGYRKYVLSMTPVSRNDDGLYVYDQSIIDEDDSIDHFNGYCCRCCRELLEYCGIPIQTEEYLGDYLAMDPILRDEFQKEWEEREAILAQIDEQNQKEIEEEVFEVDPE
jgi:hypothetical protein